MRHSIGPAAFLLSLLLSASLSIAAEGLPPMLLAPDGGRQGDPLLVWALSPSSMEGRELQLVASSGKVRLRARPFAAPDSLLGTVLPSSGPAAISPLHLFGFLLALPTDLAPGAYRLVLAPAGTEVLPGAAAAQEVQRPFALAERSFPFEKIPLDQSNSELLTVPDSRKTAEAERLVSLLDTTDATAVFIDSGEFLRPVVPLRRTAGFGDRRRYVYADGGSSLSVHEGEDLAVPKGTPVLACARGRVVMCADREVTGNSVVVEHLPGLYSIYYHLSAIDVAVGQVVERGERLGVSGSTGLSTGPHLHWELRAMGRAVNPECWVGSPLLDIKRIQATISGLFEGR